MIKLNVEHKTSPKQVRILKKKTRQLKQNIDEKSICFEFKTQMIESLIEMCFYFK